MRPGRNHGHLRTLGLRVGAGHKLIACGLARARGRAGPRARRRGACPAHGGVGPRPYERCRTGGFYLPRPAQTPGPYRGGRLGERREGHARLGGARTPDRGGRPARGRPHRAQPHRGAKDGRPRGAPCRGRCHRGRVLPRARMRPGHRQPDPRPRLRHRGGRHVDARAGARGVAPPHGPHTARRRHRRRRELLAPHGDGAPDPGGEARGRRGGDHLRRPRVRGHAAGRRAAVSRRGGQRLPPEDRLRQPPRHGRDLRRHDDVPRRAVVLLRRRRGARHRGGLWPRRRGLRPPRAGAGRARDRGGDGPRPRAGGELRRLRGGPARPRASRHGHGGLGHGRAPHAPRRRSPPAARRRHRRSHRRHRKRGGP